MHKLTAVCLGIAVLLQVATDGSAQGVGYAEAIDRVATSCAKDIAKFCGKVSLGGGRIQKCLAGQAGVSPGCTGTLSELQVMLRTRAEARAAVPRACDTDIKRTCAGVQAGDGNLMECFYKAKQNITPQCRQMVAAAGYEVGLAPAGPTTQVALSPTKLIDSLQGVEAAASISAAQLRQLAAQTIPDPSPATRVNREPLSEQLGQLAQFTIAIQFDFDSARIRPDSFRAVGLMADALYHPYLQGYRFLIVGHTDGKGDRAYNLKLSQQRADAIRDALINPFGI